MSWAAAKAAAAQRGQSTNKWKMCDADGCTSGCKRQRRAPRERAEHTEKQMRWAEQLMDGAPEGRIRQFSIASEMRAALRGAEGLVCCARVGAPHGHAHTHAHNAS